MYRLRSTVVSIRRSLPGRMHAPLHAILLLTIGSATALAQSSRVVIQPADGFDIRWDGNNGGFSSPEPGALAPENDAHAATGSYAFASSALDPGGIHDAPNVIDGYYGNSSSWIPDFTADPPDAEPYIGVSFGRLVPVRSIAWSRDNGDATEPYCGGTCTDRALGLYTIQFTRIDFPETATGTGDADTGWQTIGSIEYLPGAENAFFSSFLRHRFEVSENGDPIPATAIRILAPNVNTAIDEIEVNPPADPVPPVLEFLAITNAPGYSVSWDLNDGALHTPETPASAPPNRAAARHGTTAFASSESPAATYSVSQVHDGFYGDSRAWAPAETDTAPWVALNLGGQVLLRHVAWSRDNGDDSDCCGGELTGNALGLYSLQVTRVADPGPETPETGDPSSGWATISTLDYRDSGEIFRAHLRHRYAVALEDGSPIPATAIRLKTPQGAVIDEIEVNPHPALEQDLSEALILTPSGPYAIEWDGNDAEYGNPAPGARAPAHAGLASAGAVAFGSSELGYGIHFISKINDGVYGNSSSWISANGLGGADDPDPFIGIRFPEPVDITTVAWGRDNGDSSEGGCGGTCEDRWAGIYTIQFTRAASPGVETPETEDAETGWETIAFVEYLAAAPPGFNPARRHAFLLSRDGEPIRATGIRLKVSNGNIAIDELEVNPETSAGQPPLEDLLAIHASEGFEITWDGNEGEFSSPDANPPARDNVALASRGSIAFGSSELGLGTHFIASVNDGLHGNGHSWIPASPDANPFIGVRLPGLTLVRSIAFGRDNGDNTESACGGTCTDRVLALYTIQFTQASAPGADTPETGNAATGWQTLGTIEYKGSAPNVFTPHLRHRFDLRRPGGVLLATGIRILVSSDQVAIDELEVNPLPSVDQNVLLIEPTEGFEMAWDGGNGDYGTPDSPAPVPPNDALAARGAVAIGSSELGLDTHFIANVNDGLYGNAHSWIADFINGDLEPWVGVRFPETVLVSTVAWSRDNGDVAGDCCGGTLTDRAAGVYFLEYTQSPEPDATTVWTGDPASGWATIARIAYRGGGSAGFQQHVRHEFRVARGGEPIAATALRLVVSDASMAIDELEVNTRPEIPTEPERPRLTVARDASSIRVSWTGEGTLQQSSALRDAEWTDVPGASPVTLSTEGPARFFRIRQ